MKKCNECSCVEVEAYSIVCDSRCMEGYRRMIDIAVRSKRPWTHLEGMGQLSYDDKPVNPELKSIFQRIACFIKK